MLSWQQIEHDKNQVFLFLKHLQDYHLSLYNELIGKKLELPGGTHTTLEMIIDIMDENPILDLVIAKKLVNEYMPNVNKSNETDIRKALHILLYTTPYTVIEKNMKALILYHIHQEWPHLQKSFEFSGKRRSKHKRKTEKKVRPKKF